MNSLLREYKLMEQIHRSLIDYYELPVVDIKAAKRFYETVFGWEFIDEGRDCCNYANRRMVLSLTTMHPSKQEYRLPVIYVPDIENVTRLITANGGLITLQPYDVPCGRSFHFQDPNGNELIAWTEIATPAQLWKRRINSVE